MDLAITYTQRGSFPHNFVWETPGPPYIHTSTLFPPSRLLQRLSHRGGFKNLPPVLPALPHQRGAQGFLLPPPRQRLPTRHHKTSICQSSQESGGRCALQQNAHTSCNTKPHPKRLTTNYFSVLNTLMEIQAPKLSRNFEESWCYFHKTSLILHSSETT